MVTCGYCGEEGTAVGTNYVRLDSIHDMWCKRCEPKKEWLDREVAAGRKSKIKCTECGKKWVAARREKVEKGECGECKETVTPLVLFLFILVVGDTHVVLMLCFFSWYLFLVPFFFYLPLIFHWPLCLAMR